MNKIPKYRVKYFVSQQNNSKISQKESYKEHIPPKITQRNLKFSANRNFGKDISNSIKNNVTNLNNNNSKKVPLDGEKKQNNNVYIKKHSSASQVAKKSENSKITTNDNKLKENKSGYMINRKNDSKASEYYYNKNYYLKNDYPHPGGSKLHNSISFGMNNFIGASTNINNSMSVRLTNPINNRVQTSLNNRSINLNRNSNFVSIENNYYNNKNEMTQSNLDLM